MEKKTDSIKPQLSEAYDKQVHANTTALLAIVDSTLLAIVDSIQFPIKQWLGLRDRNWDKSAKREDGNFSSLLDFLSSYSPELKSHIHNSPKNARYVFVTKDSK